MSSSPLTRSFRDVVDAVSVMAARRVVHGQTRFLNSIERLLERLELSQKLASMKVIHVAGTKGKGTTCTYISSFLQSYGFRVGLFTSPHLTDVRERFLVNNVKLNEETFTRYFFTVYDQLQELKNSSEVEWASMVDNLGLFSFFFILCVHVFACESVDMAVVEVGIGGRLDSTNVLQPALTVITALGYDHMSILGDTIELIAAQKAGIMKPLVPCFSFHQADYPETREILMREAQKCDCPLTFYDEQRYPVPSVWPTLAVGGTHIIENSKVALLAARAVSHRSANEPLNEGESSVLSHLTVPGRSQVVTLSSSSTLFLDGAHTLESLRCAAEWFAVETRRLGAMSRQKVRRVLLFYTSRTPLHVLKSFAPYVDLLDDVCIAQVYNPRPRADSPPLTDEDAWKGYATKQMEATAEAWKELYPEKPCVGLPAPIRSLSQLESFCLRTEDSSDEQSHVFICGSFFLLADVLGAINPT